MVYVILLIKQIAPKTAYSLLTQPGLMVKGLQKALSAATAIVMRRKGRKAAVRKTVTNQRSHQLAAIVGMAFVISRPARHLKPARRTAGEQTRPARRRAERNALKGRCAGISEKESLQPILTTAA